jgi:hypothetical protein
MKIKHKLFIDGIEYTNKIINVSAFDIGVRDFIAYVSDINVELVYDVNLLDVLDKNASVYMLIDNYILRADGVIRRVEASNGKINLTISREWILDPNQEAKNLSGTADQIIESVLNTNNYQVKKRNLHSWSVNLTVNSQETYQTILEKSAQMGLYYVIPTYKGYVDVVGIGEGVSEFTITESHIIPKSIRISLTTWDIIDVLEVKWNNDANTDTYGSGKRKEIYTADYITDQTSADNFGNNYLAYKSPKKEIEFSTPLLPDVIGLDVGDIITLNYSKYSLLLDVQITQKQIEESVIKFKCREA